MPQGYWSPVLHAHLPYVRHPEYPEFLEEDWFFEALTETYVPLVRVLDGLLRDGVDYRLTMTLSPPLLAMMSDYLGEFTDIRRIFREVYGSNLIQAFRNHRDAGKLEIITCGATHGFFPLMDAVPEAVRAQVQIAVGHYRELLGRDPAGIWLPECGYLPGQDRFLREAGLRFSFIESHGITDAHPRPSHGVLAPILSPEGIAFFARDMESSRQVWSAETPGISWSTASVRCSRTRRACPSRRWW